MCARVAALLAGEEANLGAVDLVSATGNRMVRDITCDLPSEAHGEQVVAKLRQLPDGRVIATSTRIFSAPFWCVVEQSGWKARSRSARGKSFRWLILLTLVALPRRVPRISFGPMGLQHRQQRGGGNRWIGSVRVGQWWSRGRAFCEGRQGDVGESLG